MNAITALTQPQTEEEVSRTEALLKQLDTAPPKTLLVHDLIETLSSYNEPSSKRITLIKSDIASAIATIDFDCEDLALAHQQYPVLVLKKHFVEWVAQQSEKHALSTDIQQILINGGTAQNAAQQLKYRCSMLEIGNASYLYESNFPDAQEASLTKLAAANKRKLNTLVNHAKDSLKGRKVSLIKQFSDNYGMHPLAYLHHYQNKNYARLAACYGQATEFRIKQK